MAAPFVLVPSDFAVLCEVIAAVARKDGSRLDRSQLGGGKRRSFTARSSLLIESKDREQDRVVDFSRLLLAYSRRAGLR
jgi:hypothetical protein